MARITINGISVDPLAARVRGLEPLGLTSADAASSNYILLQAAGPLDEEQKAQLAGLGVEIQAYVPEDTYVAGYKPADLQPIRDLPFITWVGIYLRAFKIAPSLAPQPATQELGLVAPLQHGPSRHPRTVDVLLHDGVDASDADVRRQIAAAAKLDPETLQTGRGKVRFTVQQGQLEALADLDVVHHIEEVPERRLFNDVARTILHADVAIAGTDYQGDGEVVAIADTGFDLGSESDVHPAFTGRVAKLYALGRTGPDRADDPNGHGTHVAGSVLGDGNSSALGGPIQGTAPKATLVLQSTLDAGGGLGGLPLDLHDLFEPPYTADGARVHTNSWGSTTPGLPYDASAGEIDDMVFTTQDLVICFAAGNDGVDANKDGTADRGSIGSQAAAKNCITVGASENDRPDFDPSYGTYWPPSFPADPINTDKQADNPAGMVAFSSRGPTKERRIKPDVVAPGTCILSTLSRAVVHPSTDFGTSADPEFFFDSGTSMATPLVAGCAAVLRETLIKNGTAAPTAALVKALLIQGAVELPGQYTPSEAGASPNTASGWGLVDLAGSVIIPGADPNSGFGEDGPLRQGESGSVTIEIPEGKPDEGFSMAGAGTGVTLKVTLVWSDPPGAALQNDLDLIVRAGDVERHGNAGTTDGFDRVNNVEQVVWHDIPPGTADIVVQAHRITRFPQAYAYAWRLG